MPISRAPLRHRGPDDAVDADQPEHQRHRRRDSRASRARTTSAPSTGRTTPAASARPRERQVPDPPPTRPVSISLSIRRRARPRLPRIANETDRLTHRRIRTIETLAIPSANTRLPAPARGRRCLARPRRTPMTSRHGAVGKRADAPPIAFAGRAPQLAREVLRDHHARPLLVQVGPGIVAARDQARAGVAQIFGDTSLNVLIGGICDVNGGASPSARDEVPVRRHPPCASRSRTRQRSRREAPRACRGSPAACARRARDPARGCSESWMPHGLHLRRPPRSRV